MRRDVIVYLFYITGSLCFLAGSLLSLATALGKK